MVMFAPVNSPVMHRSSYVIVLSLLGFLAFKVLRFQTLGYTFNDMYAFLQMAHSWMDGRPLLYDNIWGYHHRIHNYYTMLLWGPFVRVFGAYGLFMVQVSLLIVSYVWANERLSRSYVPTGLRYALLVGLLLGPVTLWLNDHPNIGWHTELTYWPAALLFALALTGRSRLGVALTGLFIMLIKEDGAVLAGLIHLSYDGIRYVRRHPDRPLFRWVGSGRFWAIALGWSAVFGAGMVWLDYKNGFAEPRLQQALHLIAANIGTAAFWRLTGGLAGQSLLLALPALGLLGLLLRSLRTRRTVAYLSVWAVGVAVLTVLNFVQSSHYYGQPLYYLVSLTWPPRFVLVWAFSAAFVLMAVQILADGFRPVPFRRVGWVVAGLWLVQVPILYLTRPDLPSGRDWVALLRGWPSADKNPAYRQPADLSRLRCVADGLPDQASVFAFDYVVPIFHRQYGIWPTGNQYAPADVAVLPTDDPQGLRPKLPMRQPYRIIPLGAYRVYVTDAYEPTVRACLR